MNDRAIVGRNTINGLYAWYSKVFNKKAKDLRIVFKSYNTTTEILSAKLSLLGINFYLYKYIDTELVITVEDNNSTLNICLCTNIGYIDFRELFYGMEFIREIDFGNIETHIDNKINMQYMFYKCINLETVYNLDRISINGVSSMENMFGLCENLRVVDLENFHTEDVEDMSYLFSGCLKLRTIRLSKYGTHNVKNMCGMFYRCESLENIDLYKLDTENVVDMSEMFELAIVIIGAGINLDSFRTSNVKHMNSMFSCSMHINTFMYYTNSNNTGYGSIKTMKYENSLLDEMNNAQEYQEYKEKCKPYIIDLSTFDTTNVEDMSYMFYDRGTLMEINISSFNTSNVKNFDYMFKGCQSLKEIDFSNFCLDNVDKIKQFIDYKITKVKFKDDKDRDKVIDKKPYEYWK